MKYRLTLALVALTAMFLSVMAVGALATDSNQASYWEGQTEHEADCYKHDWGVGSHAHGSSSADGVTLNAFNQAWTGDHWELLVVKAGTGNNVIQHPSAGVLYEGFEGKDVSHWIVCKGTTPDPTTTTSTTTSSTTSTTSTTTTTVPDTTTSSTTSTTTTVPTTTSSTVTTTSTSPSTTTPTTTTEPSTTTTQPPTTTTTSLVETPTTTTPETTTTTLPLVLPLTGASDLLPFLLTGIALLGLGSLALRAGRTGSGDGE